MERLYQAGYKGRKNNRGFYLYGDPSDKGKKRKKEINPEVYSFFGGPQRRKMDRLEIQNRLSLVMVNEAAYCLQEGILRSPRDGDIGAVFGLGFPPFLGGPFRYLDRLGLTKALDLFAGFERKLGPRFAAAPVLRDYGKENKRFYPEG
jgi:3-hydroxyacyl-CoA dehydrogenase/enoyl-CoA hydratase/3-hydroxybutyryl-CoA epimerase